MRMFVGIGVQYNVVEVGKRSWWHLDGDQSFTRDRCE